MRVDIVINKNKGLPNGTAAALEQELSGRLLKQFSDCRVFVRLGSQDSLSVLGGDKDAKKGVETILQETWESAEDWFY
ncbi:DinI family protein [Serratia rubidaea]|uniref:DinI family protein n=1 Tax=Serratia rubidaea TaxID=61652 RepID=UPI001F35EDD2|nr:DinI family protein [Serratia rubidaea]UJD80092.1 DinI family protein [Serratia rubidaea]UJD84648.1 DinI family protein [Serratia rubidaea]